jgi:hypothetical protein
MNTSRIWFLLDELKFAMLLSEIYHFLSPVSTSVFPASDEEITGTMLF